MPELKPKRRDFLGLAAMWTFVASMGAAVAGVMRLPKPAVLPGPLRVYKLGDPAQFAVGAARKFEDGNFFLYREEGGFHAISAICTHLGCIVAGTDTGFACPCHGSRYTKDGAVVQGPAPSGLPWLEIALSPDGQLQVNAESTVPRGTLFKA